MEPTKLTGTPANKAAGTFVLTGQPLATTQGFRNVSKLWHDKTNSYEEGLEQIERGRSQREDILATLHEMTPTLNDKGQFVMHMRGGRDFVPSRHALSQMGSWASVGRWFPSKLVEPPKNERGEMLYARDNGDAETLVKVLKNGFRRLDQGKTFLWRVRKDGTLRAMLSDKYATVDNRWFVEALAKIIPGGRLSHWRGDADTLYGNVLIPDTIREETDSDYGGMLSIGNSEIGERNLLSLPSIFRAICQNGCIWGQKKGEGIRVVHRGDLQLDKLFLTIKENLDKQIPLLPQGIEKLLGTKRFGFDGDSVMPLFAQVADSFRLSKSQASKLLKASEAEPDYARTLFGVVNAVTRAGQELENDAWVTFDKLGGTLMAYSESDWLGLVRRAKAMPVKEVEAMFALAS